jgi:hypothetical protein
MAGAKDGGLSRLSCDVNDKIARDWFAEEVKKLGATCTVDAMGSQWATIEGENNDIPPIGVGSHLDSVQTGGKFGGPLGVRRYAHRSSKILSNVYRSSRALKSSKFSGKAGRRLMLLSLSSIGQMRREPDFLQVSPTLERTEL